VWVREAKEAPPDSAEVAVPVPPGNYDEGTRTAAPLETAAIGVWGAGSGG